MSTMMRTLAISTVVGLTAAGTTQAATYHGTISLFMNAGESAQYFNNSYAYAVFPTIGAGGLVVGGAHGDGRVYRNHKVLGRTSMTQVSVGLQAGGKAYSEIIFFENEQALNAFQAGNYEFTADASAVAITAAANASAGTRGGGQTGISGGEKDAKVTGSYSKGVAIFTIAKGGLMGGVSVGGQKFSYTPAP